MFAFWLELVTGCIIMTVVVTVVMEKQFYLLGKVSMTDFVGFLNHTSSFRFSQGTFGYRCF